MRTCFYMRAEDDREIADGKIAVGWCVKMMLVLRRRPSTRGAVAFCSRFWAWSSVVLFTKLRKEMFTIIWRWWCRDRRMEKVLGMANNVQRCSVDAKLSGVAHVQLDAYSEAHHFARRAVCSCWVESVFSCVFWKWISCWWDLMCERKRRGQSCSMWWVCLVHDGEFHFLVSVDLKKYCWKFKKSVCFRWKEGKLMVCCLHGKDERDDE